MSGSNQASGSSTPNAGPSGGAKALDPYKTLANVIQKPLAPFLPPTSNAQAQSLPSILGIPDSAYTARLQGKNLLFDTAPGPSSSALVTGRKRNRGDPAAKAAARAEAEEREAKLKSLGLKGLRQVKKVIKGTGGCTNANEYLSYESLLPLHHLNTQYLIQILNLPPLPTRPGPGLPHQVSTEGVGSKLIKADFTGIMLSVLAARNPSLVGLRGIVIEETAMTFRLVPPDGRIRVIPKVGSQFQLSFPAYAPPPPPVRTPSEEEEDWGYGPDMAQHIDVCPRLEISFLGANFAYRSADRAGRKFKLAQGGGGGNGWGEEWVQSEWAGILDDEGTNPASRRMGKRRKSQRAQTQRTQLDERGIGAAGMRKKGKSRRKDPFAGGQRQVVFR